MNDPHVETMGYRIKHDQAVSYKKAPALIWNTPLFTARIEGDRATLVMKTHFAREEEAKAAVAPRLRAWEVWAGLERGPGEFEFTYDGCNIVDRRPEPGKVRLNVVQGLHLGSTASIEIDRGSYPEAPDDFEVNPDVDLMYSSYKQYREGKERLGSFANFIYTTIKGGSRRQQTSAAKKFGIDNEVLSTLNTLSSEKGGPSDARKYEGASKEKEFTDKERRWLEKAVTVIIRRAGEVTAHPARNQPVITMKDLPELGEVSGAR